MTEPQDTTLRYLAWPLYFLAVVMVGTPVLDLVTNLWPLRLDDVQWRYGSAGLLGGFLMTPLLGIALAYGTAAFLRHRIVLRVLVAVSLLGAVGLVVVSGLFALDVLQLRGSVDPGRRGDFQIGAVKAVFKHWSTALALVLFAIAAHRSGTLRGSRGRRRGDAEGPVLTRQPERPPGATG